MYFPFGGINMKKWAFRIAWILSSCLILLGVCLRMTSNGNREVTDAVAFAGLLVLLGSHVIEKWNKPVD